MQPDQMPDMLPPQQMAREPQLVLHLLLVSTVCIAALLVWSAYAPLDDIARASGMLVARGNNAVVQHPDGGMLSGLFVREGEHVEIGQALLQLDATSIGSDVAALDSQKEYLAATIRRLGTVLGLPTIPQPQLPGTTNASLLLPPPSQPDMEGDAWSFAAWPEPAAGEIGPLASDPQTQALLERKQMLEDALASAQTEFSRQKYLKGQQLATQSRVYGAERDMQAQAQNLASFRADLAGQYASAVTEYFQNEEQLKKLHERSSQTLMRAPIAGTVQNLRLNTPGASVPAGTTLMELVPADAPLEALLRLSPSHVGLIRPGQKVVLRLTAYEASHFGTLEGRVAHISADAITTGGQPVYQVWVSIPQSLVGARGPQHLKPGMVLVAAVVTGQHSVLSYLLRPIRNALDDLTPREAGN